MIRSILEMNGIPLWFFCFAVLFAIACGLSTKKWIPSLLIGYILIILGETLLFRTPTNSGYEMMPFWSYAIAEHKSQIIANILLFIPFGFLAARLWGWKSILFAAFLSFIIESVQLVFHLGLFEIDDIIHNTAGTIIGYMPLQICRLLKRNKQ